MLTTHLITPAWIQCMANQVDSVRIHWKDSAHDEDNYRVECRIGSGVWEEVATETVVADGGTGVYVEKQVWTPAPPTASIGCEPTVRSDDSYSDYSAVCNNRRIDETSDFRIFYGIEGIDECPQVNGPCLVFFTC